MKKTTTISLARTLFHIEEDAYTTLDTYLTAIKTHFAHHEDKEEILSDIEGRIAEHFSEEKGKIITLAIVESVTSAMGTIGQFDGSTSETVETSHTVVSKRMYRDPETRIIAGVASGIAWYLGVDRTIIRVLFVISLFFGGLGAVVYIVLWLVTPSAQTSAQQLEMRGEAVTLKAMSEVVKDRFKELDHERISTSAKSFGSAIERGAQHAASAIVPVLKAVLGFFVTFGALMAAATISVFAGLALFKFPQKFFGPEAASLLHGFEYTIVVLALYFSIVIPVIVVLLWGVSLLRKKSVLNKINVLAFASVWFIAIVAAGITTSRLAYKIDDKMMNDPSVIRQTVTTPLESFDSIVVSDSNDIEVVRGDVYSIKFTGSKRDIDMVNVTVADGALTISENDTPQAECLFCNRQRLSIVVTVPTVSRITLGDSSSLKADFNLADLTVLLEDSSRAVLSGSANTLNLTLKDSSHFNGGDYKVAYATVDIEDSSDALLDVSVRLIGEAHDSSSITYTGEPKVDVKTVNSSRVEKETAEETYSN